jgi:hypothetical protein
VRGGGIGGQGQGQARWARPQRRRHRARQRRCGCKNAAAWLAASAASWHLCDARRGGQHHFPRLGAGGLRAPTTRCNAVVASLNPWADRLQRQVREQTKVGQTAAGWSARTSDGVVMAQTVHIAGREARQPTVQHQPAHTHRTGCRRLLRHSSALPPTTASSNAHMRQAISR